MLGHEGLLFILLQVMIKIAVFFADENTIFSRSAYFVRQENKQLKGYVYKQFESRSLTSCSQACLRNVWCTSTNFKVSSTRDSKGTCELNKHEVPLINENTKIYDQQGVTILMIMKVMYNRFNLSFLFDKCRFVQHTNGRISRRILTKPKSQCFCLFATFTIVHTFPE